MKTIIWITLASSIMGCNAGNTSSSQIDGTVDTVSASTMYYEYTTNEVSADSKYTNKMLVVKGVVGTIAKTNDGQDTYLTIVSGGRDNPDQIYVQCFLTEEGIKQVASIRGSTAIEIVGYNIGKKISDINGQKLRLGFLEMDDCSVVLISNDITY